jgi:Na+-translocating ferredoxin:NAD+ oxidoreductase RnfG subunit
MSLSQQYNEIQQNIKEAQRALVANLLKQILKRDITPEDSKLIEFTIANKDAGQVVWHLTFDNSFIGHVYVDLHSGTVTFKPSTVFEKTGTVTH